MTDLAADASADTILDAETYRLRRAARDLYVRSMHGPFFYIIGSVLFVLTIGRPAELPPLAWAPSLLFALLYALRYGNRVPPMPAPADELRRWRFRHWLLIDAGCLLWTGHLLVAGAMFPPHSPPVMVALTCTFAYLSAIGNSFVMNRRAAIGALLALWVPGALAFAIFYRDGLPVALGVGAYGLYSMHMLERSHRDYCGQIDAEVALLAAKAESEKLVATDVLTGLANRREYERRFAQAWHMAARQRGDLALLVIDLDNFKQLNDAYGHAAGDSCLRHFAEILTRHFRRAGDLSARIGGEEFAVILPGVTAYDAAVLGEEFRRSLTQSSCRYSDHEIRVTASIGAGAADWERDRDPLATFARIDQACYEAKKQGRSRLVAV
jgi:diguanylate cyclase (GGDEF)-like protein